MTDLAYMPDIYEEWTSTSICEHTCWTGASFTFECRVLRMFWGYLLLIISLETRRNMKVIMPLFFTGHILLHISSHFQLFSQITSSMAPKFEKLMQAARIVRNTMQDIFDDNDMYLRSQRTPMEDCCKATQLAQQANFPDVSVFS